MTASTVAGTPLHHNGTDWAAIDLSVCLSVSAIHQLLVTPTCLPALLSSPAFCLFTLGLSQTFGPHTSAGDIFSSLKLHLSG